MAAPHTAPDASPVTPVFHTLTQVLAGDPETMRRLASSLGSFSMRVLVAALILAATLWASKKLGAMARQAIGRMNRHNPADTTLQSFVGSLTQYLVVVIGFIAVLQQLGVQAASVIAVLGAASLAIGLALQGTLTNVAAGVMILLLRPYRVGDSVELNSKQGKVTGLDLFNTRLIDPDGLTLHMPNGKVFGDMIVNYTQSGHRRIDLLFGIDYEDDLDVALKLLLDIAKADPRVLPDPPPWSKVTALQDSSVGVTLRCWTKPTDWLNTKFDITKQVKETFEANGLSFPYPHQVAVEYAPKTPRQDRPSAGPSVARQ
jgi:small conductance mechanosensitive channel